MYRVFFFNDTATTEIYTLSLHDALPIFELAIPAIRINMLVFPIIGYQMVVTNFFQCIGKVKISIFLSLSRQLDRKSTRLNSSHANISYAVFCLKKKKILTLSLSVLYSFY